MGNKNIDMEKCLLAYAKINLHIDVLNRLENGYHNVRMIMQQISLYDKIHISVKEGNSISVFCEGIENSHNIVTKAVQKLLGATRKKMAVCIHIEKNIPVAAGLGGGSSDAASVLKGLNELLGFNLGDDALEQIGLELGADVPFFIRGGTALAEGIGEKLHSLPTCQDVCYLLINPGFEVSTAWVYGNLRLTSKRDNATLFRYRGTYQDVLDNLHNDLEDVVLTRFPVLGSIKEELLMAGADGALMSGSGPTVFGVFRDQEKAVRARRRFENTPWRVFLAKPETMGKKIDI